MCRQVQLPLATLSHAVNQQLYSSRSLLHSFFSVGLSYNQLLNMLELILQLEQLRLNLHKYLWQSQQVLELHHIDHVHKFAHLIHNKYLLDLNLGPLEFSPKASLQ